MRVVVIGASGNVGTSVLQALSADPQFDVLALARRLPKLSFPRTTFASADIATTELTDRMRGADAVINLAWLIQRRFLFRNADASPMPV